MEKHGEAGRNFRYQAKAAGFVIILAVKMLCASTWDRIMETAAVVKANAPSVTQCRELQPA
jgi:hypothetical protein